MRGYRLKSSDRIVVQPWRRWGLGVAAAALAGMCGLASLPSASAANTKAAAPLKVYISVDMEGIAGVVTGDQLIPGGFEYERFRRFMTDEAVAAVRGAQAAGATEVVVSDSHGNGESLLIELFPKDVRIVRSWPRHGEMMAGLDSSFAAALFVCQPPFAGRGHRDPSSPGHHLGEPGRAQEHCASSRSHCPTSPLTTAW